MVKPAEKIDSIRIHQISGLNGASGGGSGTEAGDGKTPVNQALDSILGMAMQLPAMRKLGEELGLSMEDGIAGVVNGTMEGEAPRPVAAPVAPPAKAPAKAKKPAE
jgi:flotillin